MRRRKQSSASHMGLLVLKLVLFRWVVMRHEAWISRHPNTAAVGARFGINARVEVAARWQRAERREGQRK
jgi:hypothetical protein